MNPAAPVPTESELIVLAIAGDQDALSALLERYGPAVRQGLHIGAQWQGIVDADDVMQVTYVEAFLRIRSFTPTEPNGFAAWLRRIAQNNLRDAIREQGRDKRDHLRIPQIADTEAGAAIWDNISGTATTPSRAVGRDEIRVIVERVLNQLPPVYGQVLRLCDLEGMPGADAAKVLGRSHGAVRMLLARARDCMKEALGSESRFFTHGT